MYTKSTLSTQQNTLEVDKINMQLIKHNSKEEFLEYIKDRSSKFYYCEFVKSPLVYSIEVRDATREH